MKSTDFVVTGRPRLAAIKRFPVIEFADYERRLADLEPVDVVPVPPFMASSTGPNTFSFNSKPVLSGFAQTNSI